MADQKRGGRPRNERPDRPERGVGSLVASGPSIVGISGSMRARDVSRVSDEDLARAEKTVVVRRRPPDQPQRPAAPVPHPPPARDSGAVEA